MNIDVVFPVLPPSLDGIGDHTAHLARALAAQGCTVRVLTAQEEWTPLSRVTVQRAFHLQRRRGILDLIDVYRSTPHPDWLLLQFEQFSYGRWGLNPLLPLAIQRIKRIAPEMKIAVMFHEDYMPARDIKSAVMSGWQQLQFRALGRLADVAFFSVETWAGKYDDLFRGTSVHHLPVGSNIQPVDADCERQRTCLGIHSDEVIIGVFGSAHPSRLLSHIGAAAHACSQHLPNSRVLYVGADGTKMKAALGGSSPLIDMGPLEAGDVSRCFTAMDIYLAPFSSGVSTRRGSFLAGLAHGTPTVSTYGTDTGNMLMDACESAYLLTPVHDEKAFVDSVLKLAQDTPFRSEVGQQGYLFYQRRFDWHMIASQCIQHLDNFDNRHF